MAFIYRKLEKNWQDMLNTQKDTKLMHTPQPILWQHNCDLGATTSICLGVWFAAMKMQHMFYTENSLPCTEDSLLRCLLLLLQKSVDSQQVHHFEREICEM